MSSSTLICVTNGLLIAMMIVGQESPQLVILVADYGLSTQPGAIYKLNIHYMNLTTLPISNVRGPVAIDYDKRNNYIYWTDIVTKQVRRANIDGGNDRIVARLNSTSSPEGLTLDSNTGQVFYTDQGNDVIVRIEMSNFQPTTIVNTELIFPRGIVADTRNRKLYWGNLGNDPKIETCNYNGGERRTFVSSGLVAPNGVALDEQADRLFWTDGGGSIESIFLDGTDRKILESLSGIRCWDISVFGGFLYFTEMLNSRVYVKTEVLDHSSTLTSIRFQDPGGIHAFSPNIDTASSCPYGQYGLTCAKCGNCRSGGPCEKTTGICFGGCEPGFKRGICTELCDLGTFEEVCDSICSKNCKSGSVCDNVTGNCPDGCRRRWTGSNCTNASPAGNDEPTGSGETNGATGSSILLIVGVVAGVTLVLIVVILVVAVPVIRKRRRSRDDPEPCPEFDSKTNVSVNDGYMTLGNLGATGMLGPQHHRPSGTLGDAFTSRDDPEPDAEFASRTNVSLNDGYMTLGNLGTTGRLGPQHHRPSGTLGDTFTSHDYLEPYAEFDSRTNDSVNDGYMTLGNLGATGMLGPQHHRPSGTLGDTFTSHDYLEPDAEFASRTNVSLNDGYMTLGNLGTTGRLGPYLDAHQLLNIHFVKTPRLYQSNHCFNQRNRKNMCSH